MAPCRLRPSARPSRSGARPEPMSGSVHPDRVRAALDPRLSDAVVARLLACGRLRERLDARFGRDESAGDAGHAWLVADPDAAARRAGAVLHGRALRTVLSGPAATALIAAIGREAHALGLRHGARMDLRDDGGDLAGAILHDGHACLGAWLDDKPEPLRRAVLLALPPGTPAEGRPIDPTLAGVAADILALVERDMRESTDEGSTDD